MKTPCVYILASKKHGTLYTGVTESWEGVPSERLNPIEQICHVRDIEIDGYHVRFRRLLEEVEPSLPSVDGYALIVERNYAAAVPEEIFTEIRKARLQTLQIIKNLTPQQMTRSGKFEGYGSVTVRGLIHLLCSHDQQHLSGLQWLLGQMLSVDTMHGKSSGINI